jgi:hypothetical protein
MSYSRSHAATLQLARGGDGDLALGLSRGGSLALDGINNVLAFNDAAENDVGTIEPVGLDSGEEELGAVAKKMGD